MAGKNSRDDLTSHTGRNKEKGGPNDRLFIFQISGFPV